MKPGQKVIDPWNREVTVLSVNGSIATVKLYGSYGATVQYPISCLRPSEVS